MSKDEYNITETFRDGGLVGSDHDEIISCDVPAKYRGTATDQHDMLVLGKKQVLRRNFKFVTMLGFASTAMVAWRSCLSFRSSHWKTEGHQSYSGA